MGYERGFIHSQTPIEENALGNPLPAKRAEATDESAERAKSGQGAFQLSENERWYVVYAQAKRESLAEVHLSRQGFRAFVPRLEKTVRHARTLQAFKGPIFPRYLFVVLDLERDRWRSINGTSGVTSLVMAQERPLPLPRGLVEYFVRSTDEDGLLRFDDNLRPGQPIRLRTGPFAESLGVLSRLNSAARVDVLIKFMNGEVRLNVLREWVEPLDDSTDSASR